MIPDRRASGFAFEADVYATLERMPLAVRRQLAGNWRRVPVV